MKLGAWAAKKAKATKVGKVVTTAADLGAGMLSRGELDVKPGMPGVEVIGKTKPRRPGKDPNDEYIDHIREVCRKAAKRPSDEASKRLFGKIEACFNPLLSKSEVRVAASKKEELQSLCDSMKAYGMKVSIKELRGGKKNKILHYYLAVDIATCLRPSR